MWVNINDPKFSIRQMTGADVVSVHGIIRACFRYPWPIEGVAAYADDPQRPSFVATYFGEVVAFALAELKNSSLYLAYFAVDPPYQRRGIATEMIKRLREEAVKSACNEIRLHVCETDEAPQALYAGAGFQTQSCLPDFYGKGIAGFELALAL